MTKQETIMEALRSLGYSPHIDDDGDICLRYQLKTFYFMTNDDDEHYICITLPRFTGVEEGEETLNLAACNSVTRDRKLVKVYIDSSLSTVTATCEFFYTDQDSLKDCLDHAIRILGVTRSYFVQVRDDLRED